MFSSWIGNIALAIAIWYIATRAIYFLKYLAFKISVLDNLVGYQIPSEKRQDLIQRSVREVLMNDYEYRTTIKAIEFVSKSGLNTHETKLTGFDTKSIIEEIKKIDRKNS